MIGKEKKKESARGRSVDLLWWHNPGLEVGVLKALSQSIQRFILFLQVIMATKEAAERACKEPNPIIDGRKANVNLAILGAKPRINSFQGKVTLLAILTLCMSSTVVV